LTDTITHRTIFYVNDYEGGQLRMHYIDEGPVDAPTVLMIHGNPTWIYQFRDVIPLLNAAGYRTVAIDLMGMGRSDKPTDSLDYSYDRHVGWTTQLFSKIDSALNLGQVTIFGHDYGTPIGIRMMVEHFPNRFDAFIDANASLPDGTSISPVHLNWRQFVRDNPNVPVGHVIAGSVNNSLTPAEIYGYYAPWPDSTYKMAIRTFPEMVPDDTTRPEAIANNAAWAFMESFQKPFMTIFGQADHILFDARRDFIERVPGAYGQPHPQLNVTHYAPEDDPVGVAHEMIQFLDDVYHQDSFVNVDFSDFATGFDGYASGGPDCFYDATGQAIRIQGNSGIASSMILESALDLTSYDVLKVAFRYEAESMETGESLVVELWDGTNWTNILTLSADDDFANEVWDYGFTRIQRDSFNFANDAKIRFRIKANTPKPSAGFRVNQASSGRGECRCGTPLLLKQLFVIRHTAVVQAALDDLLAQRAQAVLLKLSERFLKEILQDFCALVVGFLTNLFLVFHFEHPLGDLDALQFHFIHSIAQKTTTGRAQLLGQEFRIAFARQILPAKPLRHEAGFPGTDMLIRREDVFHIRRIYDLLQQQVGLLDLFPRGEGPVAAYPLAAYTFRLYDTRVSMPSRGHQSPEPGERRRQNMHNADDTVVRVFPGTRRRAQANASDINPDRIRINTGDDIPWQDHPRVGARYTGCILLVVPDQRPPTGDSFNIQEEQRLFWFGRYFFQYHVSTIFLDMIHPDEPSILGIFEPELAVPFLEFWVAKRHIIGDRLQVASPGEVHYMFFARQNIFTQQQAAFWLSVRLLQHLAFSAATSPLVHEGDDIIVGRNHPDGRAMRRYPAFFFPLADQHAIDAFLSAWPRIEVVREHLVYTIGVAPAHVYFCIIGGNPIFGPEH